MKQTASRIWLLCALFCLAGIAGAARLGDDELVAEFKKYFRTYKDTATRVEAVLALEGHDTPEVIEALIPALKLEDADVVRAAVRVLAKFKSQASIMAVYAQIEGNKDEAVRLGLLQAIEAGKYAGSTPTLLALLPEKSWELRRHAVLALAATRDQTAITSLVPLAADSEPAVRCAVLDGLALMKSSEVVKPAIAALGDAVWQVRSSAISALAKVRSQEAIQPLIARMAVEEGRLQADIGASLSEITGRNYGSDIAAWQQFWKAYGDKFQIPSDAELKKLREQQAARIAEYKKPPTTTYHNIETPSRRIMFVIDCSGSMENLVVEKERFKDGNYPSYLRMDIVKTELMRTLESLESYVEFDILSFATFVKPWKKDLVKANVINKSSAIDWVKKLEAIGGASKEDLAQAGLTASANLDAGKTNTYGALMAALGVSLANNGFDVAPVTGGKERYTTSVDTVFFLSDGRPSCGDYVDTDDILREVKLENALRKVVIHTIAIGEFQKDFMKRLAEENGGVFVDLGR